MRYGVQYSVRAPKIFFFFFSFLYFQSKFLCTKGCLKPVEGIKKVLTFSKIGCRCSELFSHVFTPSEIFFNIPGVG